MKNLMLILAIGTCVSVVFAADSERVHTGSEYKSYKNLDKFFGEDGSNQLRGKSGKALGVADNSKAKEIANTVSKNKSKINILKAEVETLEKEIVDIKKTPGYQFGSDEQKQNCNRKIKEKNSKKLEIARLEAELKKLEPQAAMSNVAEDVTKEKSLDAEDAEVAEKRRLAIQAKERELEDVENRKEDKVKQMRLDAQKKRESANVHRDDAAREDSEAAAEDDAATKLLADADTDSDSSDYSSNGSSRPSSPSLVDKK